MMLLANSFHDYQIMAFSQYTVTNWINDEKTDATHNSKLFKKLNLVNNAL